MKKKLKVVEVGATLEKSNKLFEWSELTSFFGSDDS